MELLFANAAVSTLAAGITNVATSLSIQAADAALFPVPIVGGQFFKLTLIRKNTGAREIVHVTTVAGAVFTVTRGQEGTTALSFIAGDIVSVRLTKETIERLYQPVRQPNLAILAAADLNVLSTTGYQQVAAPAVNINRILKTNRDGGSSLTLKFNVALTVIHAVASGGAYAGIILRLGANLPVGIGQTVTLVYDEIDNAFYQKA